MESKHFMLFKLLLRVIYFTFFTFSAKMNNLNVTIFDK